MATTRSVWSSQILSYSGYLFLVFSGLTVTAAVNFTTSPAASLQLVRFGR